MRHHITPVRIAIIRKTANRSAGKHVEKKELSYAIVGNVNWHIDFSYENPETQTCDL